MSAHEWGSLADSSVAREILDNALGAVAGRSEFADARLIEAEEMRSYISMGGDPDERIEQNIGIGVRVLVDGQWGFAARPLASSADAVTAARDAHASAVAMAGHGKPVSLPPREPSSGTYATSVAEDPFAASTAQRYELLAGWLAAASAPELVAAVQAGINAKRQHRHYGDTEGSRQHQHFVETGAMVLVTARGHGDVQRRSYPNSFHGNTAAAGWEYLSSLAMVTRRPGSARRRSRCSPPRSPRPGTPTW